MARKSSRTLRRAYRPGSRTILWAGGIGLAAMLAGCRSAAVPSPETTTAEPPPVGRVWQLQEIRYPGEDVVVPDDPAKYTLELRVDGRAAARVDCNRASGGYTLDGSAIGFGPLAMTRAACPPGSLDTRYVTALGQAVSWSLEGGRLRLGVGSGGGVLVFVAGAPGS